MSPTTTFPPDVAEAIKPAAAPAPTATPASGDAKTATAATGGEGAPPPIHHWELAKLLPASKETDTLVGVAAIQALLLAQIADSLKNLSGSAGAGLTKLYHEIVKPDFHELFGKNVQFEKELNEHKTEIAKLHESTCELVRAEDHARLMAELRAELSQRLDAVEAFTRQVEAEAAPSPPPPTRRSKQ